jgi:hypothetical protein
MRTTIRLTGSIDQALPPGLEARLLEALRGWRAS